MKKVMNSTRASTTLLIILNLILIICVTLSVFHAYRNAWEISLSQNIQNISTLTDASAGKVELMLDCFSDDMAAVVGYVNQFCDESCITADELSAFIETYSHSHEDYTWQLADNYTNGATTAGINAALMGEDSTGSAKYTVNEYQKLAEIFIAAGEANIGIVQCTSEFTDAFSLTKSFAVTSTVRIASEEPDGSPQYKTLMLVMKSSYMIELISNNNNADIISYFDYSNIIIDENGDYVISDSHFQGRYFADYIALYNDDFNDSTASEICDKLKRENYTEVLYYQNSKGQDCAFTIVPVHNSDWHILSIVPLSSFENSYNFTGSFVTFAAFFALLFAVDIIFVLVINRRLRQKTKEAQDANESKSVFLSSMSHDIRTPMNAIVGMTIVANRQLDEEQLDRDALRDCMKSIELSGNHLLTLINDILDISKIESGKIVLHTSDFSIADTVSSGIEICRSRMNGRSLNLDVHIHNVTHEYVTGDSLRINQVYMNILTNAIKYTRSGGTIKVDLTEESVPGNPGMARYIYSVSDNGIGMTPEFVNSIFDRFTRAVDTRINEVQGTGLGMSIAKQLVDLMNGNITVESELNVGSAFTVTLELPVAGSSVDTSFCKGLRILIIDDDGVLLETAKEILTDAGAEADTVHGGEEGVKAAVSRREGGNGYNVIFVDWKISGTGGGAVVRRLKEKLGNSVRVVVMTSDALAEVETQARAAGADRLVKKPIFKSKLISSISSALSGESGEMKPETEKFPDIKFLVVEDNETNWKVLNKILTYYDIHADRAQNGKAAVETVEQSEEAYDLIFMDIQMPIMNGYEATKLIRSLSDQTKAGIPIYAMTADTFASDIEKCRKVGMDGHLPKPIEIKSIVKVLRAIEEKKHK